ncbi:MAG: glycosyltransferase family 39 protein [Dehalococcoidia bacterium]
MAAAVVLRALWVAYVNVDPTDGRFDDSVFYHRVATYLADGMGYVDPYGRGATAQWPPGYPVALAALYKAFGVQLWLAKALNIAAAAVTIAATYLLARQIFDRRVASLAALLLAFFPGLIFFSTLVYAETLFGMLFMLVLLLEFIWTLRGDQARWWQMLAIGVLIGWATLVRVEGLALALILMPMWVLSIRPWRTAARYSAFVALGVILALTPWTVRNAVEFHELIPLRTNAGNALANAANPDVKGIRVGSDEDSSVSKGLREQVTQPWRIFTLAGRKIGDLYENDSDGIRLIQAGPPVDSSLWETFERPLTDDQANFWRKLADRYFFAAGAAALAGVAVCLLRRNRAALLLIVTGLGWTLFFAFFNPVSRYHFPLAPVISILAAAFAIFVLDTMSARFRRRRQPG